MSEAVLISIRPEWCEKIAGGEKTIEVRKTRPKLETPFKCYIYCTNNKDMLWILRASERQLHGKIASIITAKDVGGATKANGKVIGEFVCDDIYHYKSEFWDDETYESIREEYEPSDFEEYGEYEYATVAENGEENWLCKKSCLSWDELRKYIGAGVNDFYGWHISDLVIYDEPKELGEFYKECAGLDNTGLCWECEKAVGEECNCAVNGRLHLTRPPQSWCYVEELDNG